MLHMATAAALFPNPAVLLLFITPFCLTRAIAPRAGWATSLAATSALAVIINTLVPIVLHMGDLPITTGRLTVVHAVLAVLDGYGWVVFDTTPAGALESAASSVAPSDETPPLNDEGLITEETTEDESATPRWSWMALAAGAALLPATLLILALRRKPRPGVRPEAQFLLPDPPGYLTRFRQACGRHGHPMPPGRTLRQQLSLLTGQDLSPVFADELLDYHYATTYGPTPPDRSREKALGKAIAGWQ